MDAELLTESPMMTAATFGLDGIPIEPVVTIAAVGREEQDQTDKTGKKERWGVLRFKEPWAKPYKVNSTAKRALILMFGRETDAWVGKRIVLTARPGTYFKKRGVAVRIKGSPDISTPISYEMKEFGGGKITYNLVPTGGQASSSSSKPADQKPAAQAPVKDQNQAPAQVVAPPPAQPTGSQLSSSTAQGAGAGAPATPPPAAGAPAAAPGVPAVPFGPYKGKPISDADGAELLETVSFGEDKITKEPNAGWRKSVEAGIATIRAEIERRYEAKLAAEAAPAAAGAPAPSSKPPREPGSDDDETPPF